MPDRKSPLTPLKHQTYRTIWFASIASNFGGLIQAVGAAWMMTALSSSENMIALVQASTSLPIMLFSLVSGALADSFDRRRIMISAQLLMLTASVMLTAFAWFDWLSPWLLLFFTFMIGCGTALNNPSWQASVGEMVPREDLPAAVTLNSVGFNITRSVGPAIGGVIVAIAGAAAAFLVNTFSYFTLIYALVKWQPPKNTSTLPREQLFAAISAGMRYVAMSPNIGKVLIRGFLFGLSASAILALMPLVARDLVQGGPLTYGIMLGAFGVGAIGGALISARLRETLSSEWIVRVAFLGFAFSAGVTAISTNAILTAFVLTVSGASWVLALSLFNTIVQLSTPRWVVGRALSLYQTLTFGGIAVGSWLWGSLAENYGLTYSLLCSCVLMLAGVLVGFKLTMPAFASLNLDPLNRFVEPNLRLDIKPRSGPIAILVDYEIDDSDLPEFMAIMVERRRIRLRDGAQNWTLMRDLENPDIWTEIYHVPTWVEYVRHNHRRTQADAESWDSILKLHRGATRPRVHRMIERQAIPPQDDIFHKAHIDPH
ncbi:putative major facilitator superfamily transporter [Agrobacterium rubi TR3 = NBRC 13261]|uniref:Putative major facilitator superfamily transporter n=1 Tax=Agrobacterium rubi TR3 = NBRC 13261 TaxID=1368415 RepID=A0A081CVD6_9HYPH|nr:MFS transporter [Agrobacterium rubi]MBP1879489.1 MFS family permease [Agrobacterium rubi]MCL6653305.1 ABC transporter permease [Agrobacterium rubi]GAK70632.1 putative major facilitator superfamily transporter [Agrobacterium rubi TR3 = NBRC 13261]